MFYNIFESLCHRNGTSPFAVCREIGLNGSTASYWKKSGKTPKRETLEKIADYFGCSVEYLLGREITIEDVFGMTEKNYDRKKENAPAIHSRSEVFSILGKLTDSELDEVLDFAEHLLLKRQGQEG